MPKADCLFCRIARGSISSQRVYESEGVVAFLDINPIRLGHIQIVPREHFPYYDDLPSEIANEILMVGQRLAPVLREMFSAQRVAFLFTGGDIPHAHAHVVPMMESTDITSTQYIAEHPLTFQSAPRASAMDLESAAEKIRNVLARRSPGEA
jgi:histidine triad (HIT) family protein